MKATIIIGYNKHDNFPFKASGRCECHPLEEWEDWSGEKTETAAKLQIMTRIKNFHDALEDYENYPKEFEMEI